jgi:FkbM family methyltransferase
VLTHAVWWRNPYVVPLPYAIAATTRRVAHRAGAEYLVKEMKAAAARVLGRVRRAIQRSPLDPPTIGRVDSGCALLTLGGTSYGAWTLCTTLLNADSAVYSFGVGEDISFDLALIERFGCVVHAFDPTPRSVVWVESQTLPSLFRMHAVGLAGRDGKAEFYPPENPDHISHSLASRAGRTREPVYVPVKRLSTLMRELGHHNIDLVKMDIEGAEYEALADMLASGIRPRQILVEFHHRFPEIGPAKTEATVKALRRADYRLVHASDQGMECSFVRSEPR